MAEEAAGGRREFRDHAGVAAAHMATCDRVAPSWTDRSGGGSGTETEAADPISTPAATVPLVARLARQTRLNDHFRAQTVLGGYRFDEVQKPRSRRRIDVHSLYQSIELDRNV